MNLNDWDRSDRRRESRRRSAIGVWVFPVLLAGCGGGASPTSPGAGVTATDTFMGTTLVNGPGTCGGDSHDIQLGAGPVSATLVQTTGGTAVMIQLCAGGIDDRSCTINQMPIAVGQTVSAPTRKGGSSQNLKLLPLYCGSGAPPPPGPIQYTVTLTYQK